MAKHSDSWSDELCRDHWEKDDLLNPGQLGCISRWHELWANEPALYRRVLGAIFPYGSSIESFSIDPLETSSGGKVRVLYVNGLLGQSDTRFGDWVAAGQALFPGVASYGLRWESRRAGTKSEIAAQLGEQAMYAFETYGASLVVAWHATAMKASDTGKLLAKILMRTEDQQFVLCGHSLGARVIFYALVELARCGRIDLVRTAHLMGGAVGIGDRESWNSAISVCAGGISNYFSANDDILRYLYIPAMGFRSEPIGRNPLRLSGVRDIDVTGKVGGHTIYKEKFAEFARFPFGL